MKIASFDVRQSSRHQKQISRSTEESLTLRNGTATVTVRKTNGAIKSEAAASLQLSREALWRLDRDAKSLASSRPAAAERTQDDMEDTQSDQPMLRLLEQVIYVLTGKRIRLQAREVDLPGNRSTAGTAAGAGGFGFSYDYHAITVETESVHYEAAGVVTTADGRRLSFAVQLDMSRAFYQERGIRIRAGTAVDPLVISLDGAAPVLSRERYAFDLDGDGLTEDIAFATGGSGFLALDKNGDGQINDGTELFGPAMGDGFAELALYDLDNNGLDRRGGRRLL